MGSEAAERVVTVQKPTTDAPGRLRKDEINGLQKELRKLQAPTSGGLRVLRERWEKVQQDPFAVKFDEERSEVFAGLPESSPADVAKAVEIVKRAKSVESQPPSTASLLLFYHYARAGETNRMKLAFYDYRTSAKPPVSMNQVMMIEAAMTGDNKLAQMVLADWKQSNPKWDALSVNITLKAAAVLGPMPALLEAYEKLFEIGQIPTIEHLYIVLAGAARAGCVKTFSRFYNRLSRKRALLPRQHLKRLLASWGRSDDVGWRASRQCSTKVMDFVFMVQIATKYRNYDLAMRMLTDVLKLDKQPTYQLYEEFIIAVQGAIPRFHPTGRALRLRWRTSNGAMDKATINEANAWVKTVRDYIGEENLSDLPQQPHAPKPRLLPSRKQRARLAGKPPLVPYKSKWTDDSKLFEFVPHYLRRVERERKEALRKDKKQTEEKIIDEDLERARRAREEWQELGFKGDYPMENLAALRGKLADDVAKYWVRDKKLRDAELPKIEKEDESFIPLDVRDRRGPPPGGYDEDLEAIEDLEDIDDLEPSDLEA